MKTFRPQLKQSDHLSQKPQSGNWNATKSECNKRLKPPRKLSGRFAFASWTNCAKKNYFAEMDNIYLKRRINWVLQYPSVNWTHYNNSLNVKYCLWSWKPRYPVCYTEGGSWQASSLQSCWPQLGSQIVESKPCAVVNYYRNKERKVTNSGVGGL